MVELQDIEKKWQHEWERSNLFVGKLNKNKKKFFATFPYPYLNGPLHLGHAFTSTRVDVFSRYKRLKGYNVLFPFGFHATGEPIVGMAKRIKACDEKQINVLKESGVSNEDIKKFEDPYHIVKFYKNLIKENAKSLGLSIDWTRSFTTIDDEYTRFISWQYNRLKNLNYVIKGTHPVIWCPKDQSPTGDHDRLEGEGVSPIEFTILKFKFGDSFLVAATLRPETIFGVTNIWVKPNSDLVKAKVNNEKWIVSKEAAAKLSEQLKDIKVLEEFEGRELINKVCINPVNKKEIKILPADFVDPDNSTGIVMSVPAHAPYDYIALRDLEEQGILEINEIKPVSLIKVEGYGKYPAVEVCNKLKIENQKDSRLEGATKEVYKKEFHTGILNENCGKYNGLRVSECKEVIIKDLKEQGIADSMYETEDLVICRCNTKCIVKILKDQWFLKYSDEKWKELVRECLANMELYPEESRKAFEHTIEWLQDKACARRSGLGTKLPWDSEWIVETLSDSTIYMAFYTIAYYIYNHIDSENLNKEVFDYIFLGENKKEAEKYVNKELLDSMRDEFLYWYPLDFRNSADELINNHLTFFIFHHTALFPENLWPKGIGVNGMMVVEGEKMSKSKGNFITVANAIKDYSADVIRMNLMYAAEGMAQPDWKKANAIAIKEWLLKLIYLSSKKIIPGRLNHLDVWIISRTQKNIKNAELNYELTKVRSALQYGFYNIMNDIKWYIRRSEDLGEGYLYALESAIKMLSPVAPHAAEECWHLIGNKSFVSVDSFPEYDEKKINEEAEALEGFLIDTIDDVKNVKNLVNKRPQKINLFVASKWKYGFFNILKAELIKSKDMKAIMTKVMVKSHESEIAKLVSYYLKNPNKLPKTILGQKKELEYLFEEVKFLEKELECKVEVLEADSSGLDKAKQAVPGKVAIVIE